MRAQLRARGLASRGADLALGPARRPEPPREWTFLEITEDPDIFYFTPFSALYLKGL